MRTLREVRLDDEALPGPAPEPPGRRLVFTFVGDGFLRHMVRALVGSLVEVGRGRWPPGRMAEILASGDRALAGPTAPPHGLFLVSVSYC